MAVVEEEGVSVPLKLYIELPLVEGIISFQRFLF